MRKLIPTILAFALAVPIMAQMPMPKEAPGKLDPKRVTGGTYNVDTNHTLVSWSVNHFGFTDYFGLFGGATGSLTLDPKAPNKASVNVTIPMSGLTVTNSQLNGHLNGAEFFNVAQFSSAKFVSTMVMASGNSAMIHGDLTLHGVTKPVMLNAKFSGAGINSFNKKETIGFSATTTIKRSDFGISGFIPLVGDAVDLKISVAFEK